MSVEKGVWKMIGTALGSNSVGSQNPPLPCTDASVAPMYCGAWAQGYLWGLGAVRDANGLKGVDAIS
jgi:hypothetical protein